MSNELRLDVMESRRLSHPIRSLVLFSGGADSSLLLWNVLKEMVEGDEVVALTFDYGQIHAREEIERSCELVSRMRRRLGPLSSSQKFVHSIIRLDQPFNMIRSPLLSKDFESMKGRVTHRANEAHVPSRNLIFLAVALGIAESWGYGEIWYGPDLSDTINGFPDCTRSWVERMSMLAHINGTSHIAIFTPLLDMTKETVFEILEKEGFSHDDIFSGYGWKWNARSERSGEIPDQTDSEGIFPSGHS